MNARLFTMLTHCALVLGYAFAPAYESSVAVADDEFEHEPINYSKSEPDNAVSRLFAEVQAG